MKSNMKFIPRIFIFSICFSLFLTSIHGQDTEINPGEIIIQDGVPSLRLFDGGSNEVGEITSFLGALIIENPSPGTVSQTLFVNDAKTNLQLFSDGDAYFKYKVGVGYANPQERLEVNGNIRVRNGNLRINQPNTTQSSNANGIRFIDQSVSNEWRIMNTGTTFSFFKENIRKAYILSDGTYVIASDARFKENIKTMDPVLDRVLQLRPVTYNYKDLSIDNKSTGLIAQEVQKIFPDAVSTNEDGTLGVGYDYFAILSIQAIKEQQEIIAELWAENKDIRKLLSGLTSQLNNMTR